jgi:hypothetical protein
MENYCRIPLTREYETRGCTVKIDAASSDSRVIVDVRNIKTGDGSSYTHVILPGSDIGYMDRDVRDIRCAIDDLLDKYGEPLWKEIDFTNQILS